MDNGWAIVIGAAIALISAIGAPWAQSAVTTRAQRKRDSRVARGEAIARVIRALMNLSDETRHKALRAETVREASDATLAFELTLEAGEGPAGELVSACFRTVGRELSDDPEDVLNFTAATLLSWHRGEVRLRDLVAARADVLAGGVLTGIPSARSERLAKVKLHGPPRNVP